MTYISPPRFLAIPISNFTQPPVTYTYNYIAFGYFFQQEWIPLMIYRQSTLRLLEQLICFLTNKNKGFLTLSLWQNSRENISMSGNL
jgi:hypothetical protein